MLSCSEIARNLRRLWGPPLFYWTGALLLLIFAVPSWGYNSISPTFTLVAVPDPQYETLSDSAATTYYDSEMNWVVNNRNNSTNVGFVFGEGDNQQDGNFLNYPTNTIVNTAEWQRASAAWDILKNNNVPYFTVIGNHDYMHWSTINTPTQWDNYFNNSTRYNYAGATNPLAGWNTAADTPTRAYNGLDTYTYFYAGGYKFLDLNLQFQPDANDVAWAKSILNLPANQGLPTILLTHDYQDTSGRDAAGTYVWNNLVNSYSQIFMVLSGHVSGVHQQTSTDAAGKSVFEILTDYQDYPQAYAGGEGYMRLLNFNLTNPSSATIGAQVYSPALGTYINTGSGATASAFTLSMNFQQRFGAPPYATGQDYYWDPARSNSSSGGGVGSWDPSTTSNWYSGSTDVLWSATGIADAACFGGAGGGVVTIASAGVSVNDMIFKISGYSLVGGTITLVGTPSIDTSAAPASVANVLAGSAGLVVSGGALTLSGGNTFTGGLTVSSNANLTFTADNNLGASAQPITLDGGTLTYNGSVAGGLTLSARPISIGNGGGGINVPNAGSNNGKLVINGQGLITGAAPITKSGIGWLTLYGGNSTLTSDWTVNGGVLEAGGTTTLGSGSVTVNNGGELSINISSGVVPNPIILNTGGTIGTDNKTANSGTYSGSITANGNFNVRLGDFYDNYSEKVVISGNITGTGTMTTIGPAQSGTTNAAAQVLTLSGDNSTFSGGIVIPTGTVVVGATAGRPLGTGAITLAGGKLALQGQALQTGAAAASPGAVSVSGFNTDVIYGEPDYGGTTTATLDGSFSFYQNEYIPPTGSLNAGAQLTGGLSAPDITSAVLNTVYQAKAQNIYTPFSLQSFTANNSLRFVQGTTGTLTLNIPGVYSNLAILATSTYAADDTPNVTLHFSDGTSVTTTYKAYDWYMNSDSVKLAADVFGTTGIERYSPTQSPGWDQRAFGIYETDIDLTNIGGIDYSYKQLASVTFSAAYTDPEDRGTTNIFAISGAARSWVTSTTTQAYVNAFSVTADSSLDVSGALNATIGTLAIGSNKLSVTSASATSSAYSLTTGAVTISGNASFDVAASSGGGAGTVNLAAVSGAGSITKSDSGTLCLTATSNSFSGGMVINGGTVAVDGIANIASLGGNGTGTLNVVGGSLAIALHAGSTPSVTALEGLAISAGGKLDLANNDLIVHNGSLGTITGLIQSGYTGYWTGVGLTSSTAAQDSTYLTALGVMQPAAASTFDGQSVVSSDVLLKYTYYGDANLSGSVDGTDYTLVDAGFISQSNPNPALRLSGWQNGDFNYDGHIDASDYTLMDNAFNQQQASLADEIASPAAVATYEIASGGGAAAVPEPGILGLLVISTLVLLQRRSYGSI